MNGESRPGSAQLSAIVESRAAAGDLRGALGACERLTHECPDHAWGWYLAAWLLRKTRDPQRGLEAARRAYLLEARERYLLEEAKCLFDMGQAGEARELAAVLAGRDLKDATLHDELGGFLNQIGDQRGALTQYTRASALAPSEARHHYNRAAVLRYLGDADGAESAFDAALRLRPDDCEAIHSRSKLRRQTPERNHVREIEAALIRVKDPAGRVELCYALAKEYEDLGEYARAFERLREGAGLKRRQMSYDVATDLAIMERIAAVYGTGRCSAPTDSERGAGVIFVFGMPRTGTTLVERVLASHPEVSSAGELSTFSLELTRLTQALPGPPLRTRRDFVDRSASVDFAALGEAYLRSARPYHDGRPYFVDKLPFNYLYAGLIRLALPAARMVRLERHPMDTCYAVYKQLFRDAYPFSYDLDDLGRYFMGYSRLMRHWDAVLPGAILTIRYEALVQDPEAEVRRLLAHCGLAWDGRCLRFHENQAASTTASALQVRRPIYTTSIGQWRNYSAELEPLRMQLEASGIDTR